MIAVPLLPEAPPGLRTIVLAEGDAALLQRLFDTCPDYFRTVQGEVAAADEAQRWMSEAPPPGMPFSRCWRIGTVDAEGTLAAFASGFDDLLAPGVCHVGLFMVAADRHGSGVAPCFYRALEAWARVRGAAWMRLGVVVGNTRAERFWRRQGFAESRLRTGMPMGSLVNTVRAMFKPLAGGTREDYLALVARDRPEPETA